MEHIKSVRFMFVGLDKSEVYQRKMDTRDELLVRISDAAARIKGGDDKLRRTTREHSTRVANCIDVCGRIFGYLLWNIIDLSFLCNKFVI
jgi:hypothetical protein